MAAIPEQIRCKTYLISIKISFQSFISISFIGMYRFFVRLNTWKTIKLNSPFPGMCVFYQLLMAIHIHTTNQLRGSTKGAFTLISQIHHAFLLFFWIIYKYWSHTWIIWNITLKKLFKTKYYKQDILLFFIKACTLNIMKQNKPVIK